MKTRGETRMLVVGKGNTDGEVATRTLFDLSDQLVLEQPLSSLLSGIVESAAAVPGVTGAAVVIHSDDTPAVVAERGTVDTSEVLDRLVAVQATTVGVGITSGDLDGVNTPALAARHRPVGLLVIQGLPDTRAGREVLGAFATYAALAIERGLLHERALGPKWPRGRNGWES